MMLVCIVCWAAVCCVQCMGRAEVCSGGGEEAVVRAHVCARMHVPLTRLRQGPQLQQITQPGPQEPRHEGHHHPPLFSAAEKSSPWRLRRHLALHT